MKRDKSMDYKLNITFHANQMLDEIVYYLIYQLHSREVAEKLLNQLDEIYIRLEESPYQFSKCHDFNLEKSGYREAFILNYSYILIFKIQDHNVYVMGIFHRLENYSKKLEVIYI